MSLKLTKRSVDAAQPREKPYIVFDTEIHGFGLRVYPSGEKHFCFRYRLDGRDRKMDLGRFGNVTADQARRLALRAAAKVADTRFSHQLRFAGADFVEPPAPVQLDPFDPEDGGWDR